MIGRRVPLSEDQYSAPFSLISSSFASFYLIAPGSREWVWNAAGMYGRAEQGRARAGFGGNTGFGEAGGGLGNLSTRRYNLYIAYVGNVIVEISASICVYHSPITTKIIDESRL